MPGLFGIINIGLSALLAHRNSLAVRAQNLANVDTPGYSRQDAILGTNPPLPPVGTAEALLGRQYGTGVNVASIYRARESFLGIQVRISQGWLGRFNTAAYALRQAESVLAPGSGEDISAVLDRFWDAWESVGNKAEDIGLRYVLQGAAVSLANTFRESVERLNTTRVTLDDGIRTRVEEINGLAVQIAEYNRQITVGLAEGRAPNDLLDRRDVLLERLAELTGGMPANSGGGYLSVYLDGRPLVQGGAAYRLSVTAGAGGMEVRTSYDDTLVNVEKGEIGGLLYARDTAIPGYLNDLDSLASTLVAEVNALHQAGFGLDGVSGRDFFLAGTSAGDIALDPAIMAEVRAMAAGAADAPGDGTVAQQIADLRTTATMGGRSMNESAHLLLGVIGADVFACEDGIRTQGFALSQIRQQQQSVAGVSIDEELLYLAMSQRSYAAAARVVKVADEMIGIILERMGV